MGLTNQTDLETFKGLKSKDNKAYEILYKFYYPSVKNFITKNSGCEDDAQDIFQETILVLLEKVPKEDFNLTSSLKYNAILLSKEYIFFYFKQSISFSISIIKSNSI